MSKPATDNVLLYPRNGVRLDTVGHIRSEMARLYRLWLKGKIVADDMTKGTYSLKEQRAAAEGELLEDVQARLTALGASVEARRGR